MYEAVVRSIAHIGKINGERTVFSGIINHLTEGGIFVSPSGRLDHKVGEAPVEKGVECIDVNLVKAPS